MFIRGGHRAFSGGGRRFASYSLPQVKTLDNLRLANKDFGGLFSSGAVNELWYKRGGELVACLNQLMEDNSVAERPADMRQLVAQTFNKPALLGVHAYAAMLHNLQFFVELLKPDDAAAAARKVRQCGPEELLKTPRLAATFANEPTDPQLRDWIISSFGLIAEFRTLLLNSAKSIKGDGSVWLVAQAFYSEKTIKRDQNQYSTLAVMNTYGSGTVNDALRSGQMAKMRHQQEAKAEYRRQQAADAADAADAAEGAEAAAGAPAENELELGTVEEAEEATLYLDKNLVPLLAIDASPRTYLLDYGVFGKQVYLDNVWDTIDWSVVGGRAPPRLKPALDYI